MKVSDLGFFEKYVKVRGNSPVSEAAKEMVKHKSLDVIVVGDNDELIGIITFKKILEDVVAKGLDPSKVKSAEIVTKNYATVSPDDDVEDCMIKYMRFQIQKGSAIPSLIILDGNKFKGLLPIALLFAAISPQRPYTYFEMA
jgi:CBS domain-containing protein